MKKPILLMGVLGGICVLVCACAAPYTQIELQTPMPMVSPTPSPEPVYAQGEDSLVQFSGYNRYALPKSLRSTESFPTALYKQLIDAASAGDTSATIDGTQMTAEQVDAVRSYIVGKGMVKFLSDISLNEGTLEFKYATESSADISGAAGAFDAAVEEILQVNVQNEMTKLDAAMKLYQYLSQMVEYGYEAQDDPLYGAIVDKKATAVGYAYAYAFLLDQLGIDNVLATTEDESHIWNIINIDGYSYHVDATFGASLANGQSLRFFGMMDAEAKAAIGYGSWQCTNGAQAMDVPACENNRFSAVVGADRSDVDYAEKGIYMDGYQGMDGIARLDITSGEVLAYMPLKTDGFVVLNSKLYYISQEDKGLYVSNLQSGETSRLFEGSAIASIERRGNRVYYGVENEQQLRELIQE